MKWPRWGTRTHPARQEADKRLSETEARADEIEQRASRAMHHIIQRAERNHWTETAQAIVRGRRA